MKVTKFEDLNDVYQQSIMDFLSLLDSLDFDTRALVKALLQGPFTPIASQIKYTKVKNQRFVKEIILSSFRREWRDGTIKLKIENDRLAKIQNKSVEKQRFTDVCIWIAQNMPFKLTFNMKKVDVA